MSVFFLQLQVNRWVSLKLCELGGNSILHQARLQEKDHYVMSLCVFVCGCQRRQTLLQPLREASLSRCSPSSSSLSSPRSSTWPSSWAGTPLPHRLSGFYISVFRLCGLAERALLLKVTINCHTLTQQSRR